MIGLGFLVALPFTLQFDSSMAQGVVLAKNHSAFYQLCVLWALPVGVCLVYLVKLFLEAFKMALQFKETGYFYSGFMYVRNRISGNARGCILKRHL